MYQAVEAVCRAGQIVPLEPVRFEENEQVLIVRIPVVPSRPVSTAAEGTAPVATWHQFVGRLKGAPNWSGDPLAIQESMRHDWD